MDREQKRKQRVQLRCLKKLDKKEEKLLEERNPSLIAQKAGELTAPVREKLREKVPEKFSDGAQAAAEKSPSCWKKPLRRALRWCWRRAVAGLANCAARKNCGKIICNLRRSRCPAGSCTNWDARRQVAQEPTWRFLRCRGD